MFQVTVHDFGELAIVRFAGRLVRGEAIVRAREAMKFRTSKRVLVLDATELSSIDAAAAGLLASVCAWTESNGTRLKLMNPPAILREVLQRTGLAPAFEFCTCEELASLFGLASRAAGENLRTECLPA